MKVIILISIAGHADPQYDLPDFSFRPGEEVELHDFLASAWVQSGVASLADPADAKLLIAIEEAPSAKVLGFNPSELSSKNKADLIAFAKEHFGLELASSLRKGELIVAILERAESGASMQAGEPGTNVGDPIEPPVPVAE